jgi:hypothetical protein
MMKTLLLSVATLILVACGPAPTDSKGKITMAEFDKIMNGMPCDQLPELIGSPGQVMADSDVGGIKTTVYKWDGVGTTGANASVTCQNGAVVTKAQAGLK